MVDFGLEWFVVVLVKLDCDEFLVYIVELLRFFLVLVVMFYLVFGVWIIDLVFYIRLGEFKSCVFRIYDCWVVRNSYMGRICVILLIFFFGF